MNGGISWSHYLFLFLAIVAVVVFYKSVKGETVDTAKKCNTHAYKMVKNHIASGMTDSQVREILENNAIDYSVVNKQEMAEVFDPDREVFSSKLILIERDVSNDHLGFTRSEIVEIGFSEEGLVLNIDCELAHTSL